MTPKSSSTPLVRSGLPKRALSARFHREFTTKYFVMNSRCPLAGFEPEKMNHFSASNFEQNSCNFAPAEAAFGPELIFMRPIRICMYS